MKKEKVKQYQITLTEKQIHVLMDAMEIYARLGIGQFRDALEKLPLASTGVYDWHTDMDIIGKLLSRHTKNHVDGWQSSLSICSPDTNELAKIAWDLYQVVRNRLSWGEAVEKGIVSSIDSLRKWPEMCSAFYNEPMVTSTEPLAKIEGVE